jgi:alpha-L-fucosidase
MWNLWFAGKKMRGAFAAPSFLTAFFQTEYLFPHMSAQASKDCHAIARPSGTSRPVAAFTKAAKRTISFTACAATFAMSCSFAIAHKAGTHRNSEPLDKPQPLSQPRPSAATVKQWGDRKFGMFIHFGLYSQLGGMWEGKKIDNGYSEQIMANAPVAVDQYAATASSFNPAKFDADAIVALAKAAGMKFIVVTAKHHDGFNMFHTAQTKYNIVDATPYKRDIVKELEEACARGGIKFGVYYSSIDWHEPGASTYIEGNSNPIPAGHEAFNVAQLKELLSNYGPISEIWFDMGKPTPAQSMHFAQTVHRLQPETMVSGRVFNYEGDFTVMGDNEVPAFQIDEPWQTPASIFPQTWGYRSWQKREDLQGKIDENILRLVQVVSRGGNYILNIGPMGDGSVVPYEADVLKGIGQWLKDSGSAIYGTSAQPFRKLDFGYATVGGNMLYLFVRDLPHDGTLHLPGVTGAKLRSAYLLSDSEKEPLAVQQDDQGASIALPADALKTSGFLPVIAVPFTGTLVVIPPSLSADADGSFLLKPEQADHFQNYNGYGYGDPPTLYKLRWIVNAKPGKYKVVLDATDASKGPQPDVVIDGKRLTQREVSMGEPIHIAKVSGLTSIEITPHQPFSKGTRLPEKIESVRLIRIEH